MEREETESKARAFDRIRDLVAEFGDDLELSARCIGEELQNWERQHPDDRTVLEAVDGLDYFGCVTGDCPDGHTANDCLMAIVGEIRQFCDLARARLAPKKAKPADGE